MLTQSCLSRVPEAAETCTLQTVQEQVRASDLPRPRKQDMIAALNTVARVLGLSIETIPADPRLLARRLAEADPLANGVSKSRWNNVRSLTRAALEIAVTVTPSRNCDSLDQDWEALRQLLSQRIADPRRYSDLGRFMHFCSGQSITPMQVDQSVFDRFRTSLDASLRKNPAEAYAGACRTWNKGADTVPGWPAFRVERPSRRNTWTLPWSAFPSSLSTDVQSWLDRLGCTDPTVDLPFRPVRPSTLRTRRYQLQAAASALVRRGRAPASIVALHDLVRLDSFKEIIRHLLERRDGNVSSMISGIAMLLKSIARHHANASQETLDAMAAVIRRLQPAKAGLARVNRDRLHPLNDRSNALAILQLPRRLVREAARERPCKAALMVQTALLIEIEIMTAIRVGNLAELDIERHLVRTRKGRQVSIVIEEHEVKNREPLDFPLPDESVELLDTYLRDHRPRLCGTASTALFPGRGGRCKSANMLRTQITGTVKAYTGLRINPHLFRHIGAKLYLDHHPGGYAVISRVLGHRSIDTTTGFYTGLETAAAVRHFDQTILALRHAGPRS